MNFDKEFIEKLVNHDQQAFNEFYLKTVDMFFRYLNSYYFLDEQDAEDMAQDTFHFIIQGRVSGRIICQQQVEDQEGQHKPQHADHAKAGSNRHIAVARLPGCLNQFGNHDARTQVIADIGKIDIEVRSKLHIIKSHASHTGNQRQGNINGLKDQLRGSAFRPPLLRWVPW